MSLFTSTWVNALAAGAGVEFRKILDKRLPAIRRNSSSVSLVSGMIKKAGRPYFVTRTFSPALTMSATDPKFFWTSREDSVFIAINPRVMNCMDYMDVADKSKFHFTELSNDGGKSLITGHRPA
jgi:hypothetical protein